MLAALDMAWIHWPSAIMGVVMLYAIAYIGFALVAVVFRVVRWFVRRRAVEREVAERAPAPNPLRGVCAWCGITYRQGREPASHGVCDRCAAQHFGDDTMPGAYTVPMETSAGEDTTARYRRMLNEMLGPRERVLSLIESEALYRNVMGQRSEPRRNW